MLRPFRMAIRVPRPPSRTHASSGTGATHAEWLSRSTRHRERRCQSRTASPACARPAKERSTAHLQAEGSARPANRPCGSVPNPQVGCTRRRPCHAYGSLREESSCANACSLSVEQINKYLLEPEDRRPERDDENAGE